MDNFHDDKEKEEENLFNRKKSFSVNNLIKTKL